MIGVIYQFCREREGGREIPVEHSIPIQSTGEKEQDHQQSDEHLSGLTAIEIVCVCLRRSTTQFGEGALSIIYVYGCSCYLVVVVVSCIANYFNCSHRHWIGRLFGSIFRSSSQRDNYTRPRRDKKRARNSFYLTKFEKEKNLSLSLGKYQQLINQLRSRSTFSRRSLIYQSASNTTHWQRVKCKQITREIK